MLLYGINVLTDPKSESRLNPIFTLEIYVPRDERFGHLKMADFLTYGLKSVSQSLKPKIEAFVDSEFDSFEEVRELYEGGLKLPEGLLKAISDQMPAQMLKEIFRTDGERFLKFPVPLVIKGILHISNTKLRSIPSYLYWPVRS